MINEPTAASLAYANFSLENAEKKIVVIDFGGGTLDITLLNYKKDSKKIYCDVQFTYGNTNFGGEDFDNELMSKCIESYTETLGNENNIFNDNNKSKAYILRLKRACERAKIKLSSFPSTKIHVENYLNFKGIDFNISKNEFVSYCNKLFDKFKNILADFIIQSKIKKDEISEVILIGGTTLIPEVKNIISNVFDDPKTIIQSKLDPKEVVAMGAAIRGGKNFKFKIC